MSTQITVDDFEEICRTCLIKKENMSVFRSEKIIEMIQTCSCVQVSNDDKLPNQICMDCLEQLLKSYHFKQQCEQSNEILLKVWNNSVKVENKSDITRDLNHEVYFPIAPLNQTTIDQIKLEYNIVPINKTDSENEPTHEQHNTSHDSKDCSDRDDNSNDTWQTSDSDNKDDADDSKIKNTVAKSQILIKHTKLMDGDKCDIANLTCNICKKSVPTLLSLARHMNTHSETRIITLKCEICGRGFSDPGNLTKHRNRHKGNPQYNCDQCNKKFYELHPLAIHMKKKHDAPPIKCNHCGMVLYHPLQQQRHDRLHAQKVCNVCGKICRTSKLLKRHKSSHSNNRPFSCDSCDKCFKFRFEVTKHKKICHGGPQPREICSICGKSVMCRSFQSHLKSHDKGTYYKCDYCPKGYYCEETLKQHVRHKHTNKDCHYKLLCSICGRKVISPKDLKIHMTSHTEEKTHQCHLCEKRYKTPGALLTHVRYTHEDIRPHSCTVCMKAFHTKVILNNHMRTHTGERPFSCPVCNRAFSSKSILKTHMKTHKDS